MKTHVLLAVLVGWSSVGAAQVPSQFSVQGILRDGSGKLQSMNATIVVQLYDAQTLGNPIGAPLTASNVPVDNGLFTVAFTVPSLTDQLKSVQPWVELSVGNDTYPRQLVTPVIYSVMAKTADSLSSNCVGCVSDANIASGVAAAKISGALTNATIAPGSITSGNLAISGTVSVGAHLIGTGPVPSAAPIMPAAGTGAMISSISGTDTAGSVDMLTGTGIPAAAYVLAVYFATPYVTAPHCVISSANDTEGKMIIATTTDGFQVYVTGAPSAGLHLIFNWICIQ